MLRLIRPFRTTLLALTGLAASAVASPTPVTIIGVPAAPPASASQPGQGLCSTTKISASPGTDFPQSASEFNSGINAFIDAPGASTTYVQRTIFDLSNNNSSGMALSYGDFRSSSPSCPIGGCGFLVNDATTSFATRFRGYLNVTPAMVGRPLHFGFYADDAVSMVIFDKNQAAYPIVTRPPVLGSATWRTTNAVTFGFAGLYPVEILYTEIVDHAALECSILDGTFTDFELSVGQIGSVNLQGAGFQLLDPANFYQAEDAQPSIPADLNKCNQCSRQFANLPGNGGCGTGNYCNGAALCAPCTSSYFCGPSCAPCSGSTPICATSGGLAHCVQCTRDADCSSGMKCNTATNECQECNLDADCPRGRTCNGGKCELCSTTSQCAGVSCNCCPGPSTLKCAPLTPGAAPSCVECTQDSDCAQGLKCDAINGRCVERIPDCDTSERCGPLCLHCPNERPFCLDGQVCVQCRADFECAAGEFCVSGECTSCTTDRHCGPRCGSCGGDTPYCKTNGTAEASVCVRCLDSSQCSSGSCDPATNTCSTTCLASCSPGTYCNGSSCVRCYANTQCPCGGSCEMNQCSASCGTSNDCASVEHCTAVSRSCERGRVQPGVEPQGGGLCCPNSAYTGTAAAGLALLTLAALLLSRRRGASRP